MSLGYKFRKAEHLLNKMNVQDLRGLVRICTEIQNAQEALLAAAGKQMERCIHRCEGICCRNIELDPIISHWDLVYILALVPELRDHASESLLKEDPLYRSDCIFLQDGKGPCIFPSTLRPEVCVTTFCENDRPIRREIRQVKRLFSKLCWFVRWRIARANLRTITQMVTTLASRLGGTG